MAQLVEQRIRNAWVTSSSLVIGSSFFINNHLCFIAELAQLVEHWLPKPRVAGSSPVYRSTEKHPKGAFCCICRREPATQ